MSWVHSAFLISFQMLLLLMICILTVWVAAMLTLSCASWFVDGWRVESSVNSGTFYRDGGSGEASPWESKTPWLRHPWPLWDWSATTMRPLRRPCCYLPSREFLMLPPPSSSHHQVWVQLENPLVTVELIIEQQIKSESSENSVLSVWDLFRPI